MSDPIVRRAPGKLMLSGEYAVLCGAPAIVACVDRYVTATIRRRAPGSGSVAVLDGFANTRLGFETGADGVRWQDAGTAPALLDALLARFRPPFDMEIAIDSTAFFADGRKLGLGSSAAVAVAAGCALAEAAGDGDALSGILLAHRRFQGGRGSGADVAAVFRGGLHSVRVAADGPPQCEPLAWPAGLHVATVMTGHAASTVSRVQRFERWRHAAGAPATGALEDAARGADAAWRAGDAAAVVDALRASLDLLRAISEAAGLDYFAGGHDAVERAAADAGVLYKPCGAGGGDFGVALATDRAAMARFESAVPVTGHTIVPLSLLAASGHARRA